jgi:hypothetical protein
MTLDKKELEDFNKEMDEAFNTDDPVIMEAHQLLNTQANKKKLKVFGWVAFTISFIGIILNAWKIIW